jgi:hypothetical protein
MDNIVRFATEDAVLLELMFGARSTKRRGTRSQW